MRTNSNLNIFSQMTSQKYQPIITNETEKKSCVEIIGNLSKRIFAQFKEVLSFPINYLGSKTWSLPGLMMRLPGVLLFGWAKTESLAEQLFGKGYHYQSKALTPEQTKPYLRNASIASSIAAAPATMEAQWLEPYGLKVLSPESMSVDLSKVSGEIEINDKRFLDRKTGLKMMIVTNDDEVIINFGAAGAAKNEFVEADKNPEWAVLEKHIWNGVVWSNLFGLKTGLYNQAEQLYLALKDHPDLQGKKLTLVGHCMGGSLASYIGIKNQVKVNSFNTLAHGVKIQKEIGNEKLKHADEYVTHVSIGKDFFSDCPNTSVIDRISNLMGIRTPGNFGKHYTVPVFADYNKKSQGNALAKANQNGIHNFFVGSMMAHSGFSNRDKPINLLQKGLI